jgi:hypothetical protein
LLYGLAPFALKATELESITKRKKRKKEKCTLLLLPSHC